VYPTSTCYLHHTCYLLIKINGRVYGKLGLSNSLNIIADIYRPCSHNWECMGNKFRVPIKEKLDTFARFNCENFHRCILIPEKSDLTNFTNLIEYNLESINVSYVTIFSTFLSQRICLYKQKNIYRYVCRHFHNAFFFLRFYLYRNIFVIRLFFLRKRVVRS